MAKKKKNIWNVNTNPIKGRINITKGDAGNCNIQIHNNLNFSNTDILLNPNRNSISLADAANCIQKIGENTPSINSTQELNLDIDDKSNIFSFYPNPASNHITLKTNGLNNYYVTIYNTLDSIIKQVTIDKENQESILNIDNLSKGSYYIPVKSNEYSTVKKLIIK